MFSRRSVANGESHASEADIVLIHPMLIIVAAVVMVEVTINDLRLLATNITG